MSGSELQGEKTKIVLDIETVNVMKKNGPKGSFRYFIEPKGLSKKYASCV